MTPFVVFLDPVMSVAKPIKLQSNNNADVSNLKAIIPHYPIHPNYPNFTKKLCSCYVSFSLVLGIYITVIVNFDLHKHTNKVGQFLSTVVIFRHYLSKHYFLK